MTTKQISMHYCTKAYRNSNIKSRIYRALDKIAELAILNQSREKSVFPTRAACAKQVKHR
jgi:hypothetical protein